MIGHFHELRYAVRRLVKSPGFTLIAVLTLGLGIGANTAIFSVVNGVLLRPLPFHDPDRLVRVWHVPPAKSFPGMTEFAVSAANYIDWQRQNRVFEKMAIQSYRGFTLTGVDKPERIDAATVSADFFGTLGAKPMLGRIFSPDEDQPGRSNVVLLSYAFWQQHFGSDPEIAGRNILLDGQSYLVAGVMPPDFRYPDFAQMWTPMAWTDQQKAVRGEHHYVVIARLKPDVQVPQAQAEMNVISDRLSQAYPDDDKGWGARVVSLHQDLVEDVRPALLVLLGAVGFVLIIACVNVANLALAKTFGRRKEIAIRTAMGATSGRVMRQILVETVILAGAGGALGMTWAHWGVRLIMGFLADRVPHSAEVSLDGKVLAFTAAISILTGIAAGVLPGLRLSRSNVNEALKEGLGRTDSDAGGHRTRNVLVVAEVAFSLMLLVGAGLMLRSFQMLHEVKPGFDPHGVLTMNAVVSEAQFPQPDQEYRFFQQALDRIRSLRGVEAAGVIDDIPMNNGGSHQPIAIAGRPLVPMAEQPEVDVRVISEGYLKSMHVPVLRGRDFTEADISGRPAVVLISESMAKAFWPGEDPLGKRLTMTFFPDAVREVVGIVGDVKVDGLDQARPSTLLYMPMGQLTASATAAWRSFPMTLVVRSATSPSGMVPVVIDAVHSVDRNMPLTDILTMDDVIATSLSPQRFNMFLLGAFAALALLLASIGIYSVLSYSVRQRVQEIGIRLALGAKVSDVLRLVVVQGMKPALLGMALGAVGALALGRLVSSMVYGVKTTDPLTFVAVAGVLAGVALLASIIPAYRAAKVDPLVALRYE